MPLLRSTHDKIFGGVCGGLAHWLGWSPTLTRVLFVAVSLASIAFPGFLVYMVLWIVMPKDPNT